jgi:hypothetical protein
MAASVQAGQSGRPGQSEAGELPGRPGQPGRARPAARALTRVRVARTVGGVHLPRQLLIVGRPEGPTGQDPGGRPVPGPGPRTTRGPVAGPAGQEGRVAPALARADRRRLRDQAGTQGPPGRRHQVRGAERLTDRGPPGAMYPDAVPPGPMPPGPVRPGQGRSGRGPRPMAQEHNKRGQPPQGHLVWTSRTASRRTSLIPPPRPNCGPCLVISRRPSPAGWLPQARPKTRSGPTSTRRKRAGWPLGLASSGKPRVWRPTGRGAGRTRSLSCVRRGG